MDMGTGVPRQRAQLFAGGDFAEVVGCGRVVARREERAGRDQRVHQARVLSGEVLTVVWGWRAIDGSCGENWPGSRVDGALREVARMPPRGEHDP